MLRKIIGGNQTSAFRTLRPFTTQNGNARMADVLEDALNALLAGRSRIPGTLEDAYGEFGSTPRQQNPALAREMVGLPSEGRLPRVGTDSRREYENAKRNVQRYRKVGGQTRTPRSGSLARVLAAARRRAGVTVTRADAVRSSGANMQGRGDVLVSPPNTHTQTMPAIGSQHISGPAMGPAVSAWERGDMPAAAAALEDAFMGAYWARGVEVAGWDWVSLEPSQQPRA
jgi:hypothetical protein